MPSKPIPYRPPEAFVADWVIKKMHRLHPIQEAELWKKVNWTDPHHKQIFNDHRDAALQLLQEEGYILLEPGQGANARYGHKITLTVRGRKMKDTGGYITVADAREIKEAFQAEVAMHEGRKKKLDNRTKYLALTATILGIFVAITTLWEKCAPNKKPIDAVAAQQHAIAPDSAAKDGNTPSKKDPLIAKHHHPKSAVPNTGSQAGQSKQANPSSAGNPGGQSKKTSPSSAGNPDGQSKQPNQSDPSSTQRTDPAAFPPSKNYPIRTAHNDDIEFKLLKAEGNASSQTITLTLLLTTSAANSLIQTRVHSIFDTEGNEYVMKSHRHGAETFSSSIPLTTGVPIRCVYVFGGVLPAARTIRLFTFAYLLQSGYTHSVEFRDLFVDWN